MRHLGSIVLSLLLAPIVYALVGIGLTKMSVVHRDASTDYLAASIGVAALLGAGLVYAVLVMARLSPLGPVLVGLGYLAVTGWLIASPSSFTRTIPVDALGVRGAAWAPAGAVTALLAAPLLVTVASPRRWRRWANPPAAVAAPGYAPPPLPGDSGPSYPGAPAYPGSPVYPTSYQPAYQAPTSGAPAPAYPAPTSGPPDQTPPGEATTVLPTPGRPAYGSPAVPSAWPVRDDPETTRKLP
jgi:hypothetical protein